MAIDDVKLYYNLAKLTDNSKIITDDFVSKVCLALFNYYLDTLGDNKQMFCATFLDNWEKDLIEQKLFELESLANKTDSVSDMVTGAYLSNSEDMTKYKKEVSSIKHMLFNALMG